MEILVCVKQVPDDSVDIQFDSGKKAPKLDGVTPIVNAFDGYALEMAARYKEAHGGKVTVVSLGTEKAVDAVRGCLAVGADKGYVVSDASYEGSDTLATSYILSKAAEKIEELNGAKFDLIFCGQEATDFVSGQVGSQLAEILNLGQVTDVIAVDPDAEGVLVKKETEEGYKMIKMATPALVTVAKPEYDPRYPTMKGKMAAKKMEIPVLTASDLGTDAGKVGEAGSFVKVIEMSAPAKKSAGVKIKEATVEETVAKAVDMMASAKVF